MIQIVSKLYRILKINTCVNFYETEKKKKKNKIKIQDIDLKTISLREKNFQTNFLKKKIIIRFPFPIFENIFSPYFWFIEEIFRNFQYYSKKSNECIRFPILLEEFYVDNTIF